MKRPTMSDVAEHAGVSKTTVSHVINETRFVEEATRQRVLQAIEEMGYRPSLAARSLKTKRTGIIGIIVSDVSNSFFGQVLRGVEDILQPKNYGLIVCNTNEQLERESQYLDMLLQQRVEGIIAAATSKAWGALAEAESQHTPIVLVDRYFSGSKWSYVGVDNEGGAYLGTKHLIECGHHDIGILAGFERLSTMRERLAGYFRAMQEAGLPVHDEWIVHSELSIEAGREAAQSIMGCAQCPTALFVSNNFLSLGTLLAIKDLNLHCPDDIALVGFDDHPWAAVSEPPLTVVQQPTYELGHQAARLLLDLINDRTPENAQIMLDCELIVRKSCGEVTT